ncbi:cysteine and histidine-rich domain-containing protein morgana-like [Oppia nitens]|uniref:cysteine and histidine-rich domain-containing protein morgana-like n=1 Tax=Oppia nitens TaxID=1686743 RepID=UPI0023DB8BB0|nr:cysteine and histidine-rich domain-containing protein morgana-like [Oppia nitens]
MAARLKCRNFGCDQEFTEDDGQECRYHSGEPFFHDAYKGWTCCQQKSTDFTTFLSFKGCKTGFHSSVEPKAKTLSQKTVPKPPTTTPTVQPITAQDDVFEWKPVLVRETKSVADFPADKTVEKRPKVCRKCGRAEASIGTTECVYHSGKCIFHETLKYWTCCPHKKFTDFDDFEAFTGCQSDPKHEMSVIEAKVREDWFQTSDSIHIVLYGVKCARSDNSKVKSNGKQLEVDFRNAENDSIYAKTWTLNGGSVRPEESVVVCERTKAEIRLRKRIQKQWIQL